MVRRLEMTKKNTRKQTGQKNKWNRFCLEYVKDFNRTRAYNAAGYKAKDPRVKAHKLLATNSYVQDRIHKLLKGQEKRSVKNADDTVTELGVIAFDRGKDLQQKGRLGDRIKALDLLGRHFGIFGEDNKQKGLTLAQIAAEVFKDE